MRPHRILLVLFLTWSVACAFPVERRDWSEYTGPGAAALQSEQAALPDFPDPVEPWNRGAGVFNHGVMVGLVAPISWIYRLIIPKFGRERIQKAATNIVYPRRLMANLFSGEFKAAGNETLRFLTTTTIGIGGLFDPATRFGIPITKADFGKTFAKWGWRRSTFVTLPILGPSTVRDGTGLIPDTLLNPTTYAFLVTVVPVGMILSLNELSDFVGFYKRFTSSNFDPYRLSRLVWLLDRERVTTELPDEVDDTGAVQTLEAVFLAPRDPKFIDRTRTRSVRIPTTGKKLPYNFRMQDDPAPMVFVVPGLGGHRLGGGPMALAEMAWERGFSVVVISNSMNFEFMDRAASVALPGNAPADAADVHVALDAIHRDLEDRYPERITAHALMGYSLGAFHTLFIASSATDPEDKLIDFDRYVALDSPVRLVEGMRKLDGFFNVPLQLPPEQREGAILAVLHKALRLAGEEREEKSDDSYSRSDMADLGESGLQPSRELPFTDLQAKFLIGLAFRITLSDVIFQSQEREDLGVLQTRRTWFRRHSAYREIEEYSFEGYVYAFVLPYYCKVLQTVCDPEKLISMNTLQSIAEGLEANDKIRNFANKNDFLTTAEDREWVTDLLGPERSYFFPRGGHLGNLHKPVIQERVMTSLTDLLPDTTSVASAL